MNNEEQKINNDNLENTLTEDTQENISQIEPEQQNEIKEERKKNNIFKNTIGRITSGTKWVGKQIEKGYNLFEERDYINTQFKRDSREYEIIFKNPDNKSLFSKNKLRAIHDEENNILRTDYEIKDISIIDKLKDEKNQPYYNIRVLDTKYIYEKCYNDKTITKELFQIKYSTEAPKVEITNNIKYEDHSINAGKNSAVAVGDKASASNQTDAKMGLHIHLPKN